MSEEGSYTIRLKQQEGYQINVRFDWDKVRNPGKTHSRWYYGYRRR